MVSDPLLMFPKSTLKRTSVVTRDEVKDSNAEENVIFNKIKQRTKTTPKGKNKQAGRRLEHSQTLNSHDIRHTKDNGSAQDCRHKETI